MVKQVTDMAGNKVNKYRKIGSSLYEFCVESDAYICCFTSAGKTKAQLISAYEINY